MARRRIPKATQALRKAAKEKSGTGNHGARRHLDAWTKSLNKYKKRQKKRRSGKRGAIYG